MDDERGGAPEARSGESHWAREEPSVDAGPGVRDPSDEPGSEDSGDPAELPQDLRDTHGNAAASIGTGTRAEPPERGGLIFDREGTGPYAGGAESDAPERRPYFERGQVGPYVTGEMQPLPGSEASRAAHETYPGPYAPPAEVERPHRAESPATAGDTVTRDPSLSRAADREAAERGPQAGSDPRAAVPRVEDTDGPPVPESETPVEDEGPSAGQWGSSG